MGRGGAGALGRIGRQLAARFGATQFRDCVTAES